MGSLYFDYAACAPWGRGVREAMAEAMDVAWANPSSVHGAGRKAKRLLERAREQVAGVLGASPADIVFTSGGSEACCAAISGLFGGMRQVGDVALIQSSLEHPAVRETVDAIGRREGLRVRELGPEDEVVAEPPQKPLLAAQWINNETGVLLPIERWAAATKEAGGRVFVDAAQALGKLAIDVTSMPIDALAVGGTKVGGPSGIGAFWVRRGVELEPLVCGGGQERGRRGGTQNVIGAVGFGAACANIASHLEDYERVTGLRDMLELALCKQAGAKPNGVRFERCGTISNLWFDGISSQRLVAALDIEGLSVSAGSACSAGIAEPSPVIAALEPEPSTRGSQSVRFSLGPGTQQEDVERAISIVISVLSRFKP